MSVTSDNQPQNSGQEKPSGKYDLLIKLLAQSLRDSKINGIPLIALLILGIIVKLYSLIKPGLPEITKQINSEDFFTIAGLLLLVFFILIVGYLENNTSKFKEKLNDYVEHIKQKEQSLRQDEVAKILSDFDEIKNKSDDKVIGEGYPQSVNDKKLSEAYEELLKNTFYVNNPKKGKKKKQANLLYEKINDAVDRLKKEIGQLSRRANINLGIGSTITIGALIFLSYFILRENFNSSDIKLILIHFIPRLSLVIFIEFFSFFFLKLYRANLHEIKYYQNELTNLEVKAVAIEVTVKHGSKDDISVIVKDMSLIERNFKLQKGESTVELERNRIETNDLKELLRAALGLVNKKKE